MNDFPVGGREDNILKRWNLSLRIPEKEYNKQCNENPNKSQQIPAHDNKEHRDQSSGDQKGKPFLSDRPALSIRHFLSPSSQLIMECEFSAYAKGRGYLGVRAQGFVRGAPSAMDAIMLRGFRGNFTPSDHGHVACPDQFFYAEGFEQGEKGIYFLLIPRDFDGVGF